VLASNHLVKHILPSYTCQWMDLITYWCFIVPDGNWSCSLCRRPGSISSVHDTICATAHIMQPCSSIAQVHTAVMTAQVHHVLDYSRPHLFHRLCCEWCNILHYRRCVDMNMLFPSTNRWEERAPTATRRL
jgi:hypothetical protein